MAVAQEFRDEKDRHGLESSGKTLWKMQELMGIKAMQKYVTLYDTVFILNNNVFQRLYNTENLFFLGPHSSYLKFDNLKFNN